MRVIDVTIGKVMGSNFVTAVIAVCFAGMCGAVLNKLLGKMKMII